MAPGWQELLFPIVLAAARRAWLRSTSVLGGGESTFLVMGKPRRGTQRAFISEASAGAGARPEPAWETSSCLNSCRRTNELPPAAFVLPNLSTNRARKEKEIPFCQKGISGPGSPRDLPRGVCVPGAGSRSSAGLALRSLLHSPAPCSLPGGDGRASSSSWHPTP